jgi:predicted nucleotidyltransferase
MIRKGRNRPFRGVLKDFYELPENHQNNFLLIKKFIQNFFNEDVYVYGSFYWGNWDEESDYDVFIKYRKTNDPKNELFSNFSKIKNLLKKHHNLNVDVLMIREEIGILIP